MLTLIIHNSEKLCTFLDQPDIELYQRQQHRILNMTDALREFKKPGQLSRQAKYETLSALT